MFGTSWKGGFLAGGLAIAMASSAAAQSTWVVDSSGAGDFTSIQAAIDDANTINGDTIQIVNAGSNYLETIDVTKELTVEGVGNPIIEPPADVAPSTEPNVVRGVVEIGSPNVTIKDFEIKVVQPNAAWGILASDAVHDSSPNNGIPQTAPSGFDNLTIDGVTIRSVPTTGGDLWHSRGMRLANRSGAVETVLLRNVQVLGGRPSDGLTPLGAFVEFDGGTQTDVQPFARGISFSGVQGTIQDSVWEGFVQGVHTDFINGPVTITGNAFYFAGLEINSPNAPGDYIVRDNLFNHRILNVVGTSPLLYDSRDFAILLKNKTSTTADVFIEGNTILTARRGIWSTASRNVFITDNTFGTIEFPAEMRDASIESEGTPGPGGTVGQTDADFYHIAIDPAWPFFPNSPGSNYTIETAIVGNNFSSSNNIGRTGIAVHISEDVVDDFSGSQAIGTITWGDHTICQNNFDSGFTFAVFNNQSSTGATFEVTNSFLDGAPVSTGVNVVNEVLASIDTSADFDLDALRDVSEICLYGTLTDNRDTDGDNIEDGVEIRLGLDPLIADTGTDTDGDGLPDSVDPNPGSVDGDGDGITDTYELAFGTNPNDSFSKPSVGDVTGDGVVNAQDGLAMLRDFLGLSAPDLTNPENFDINRDKANDNIDGVLAINFALGNIEAIPFPFN